jgi:hypothetical protein
MYKPTTHKVVYQNLVMMSVLAWLFLEERKVMPGFLTSCSIILWIFQTDLLLFKEGEMYHMMGGEKRTGRDSGGREGAEWQTSPLPYRAN